MTKTIPDVATFLESPDLQNSFKKLHKEDLILLAEHFKIEVTGKNKPEIYSLVEKKLIDEGLLISTQYNEELETPNVDQNLQMQLELKKLELQAQKEQRELELQAQKEQRELEAQRDQRNQELELRKMEMEQRKLEMEQKRMEIEKDKEIERQRMEMEIESRERIEMERLRTHRDAPQQTQDSNRFDASRNIRLVPKFMEKSVDKYFPQFEKVAENLNWPRTA